MAIRKLIKRPLFNNKMNYFYTCIYDIIACVFCLRLPSDKKTYRYAAIDRLSGYYEPESSEEETVFSADPKHPLNSSPVPSDDFCVVDKDDMV